MSSHIYNNHMSMNVTLDLIRKHHNANYDNLLFSKFLTNADDMSSDELIELGRNFKDIDENRFQVWTYYTEEHGEKRYRYQVMRSFRNFLDYFNDHVDLLTHKQIAHFIQRYRNRALIIKNLYEKSKNKQQYSTISERMWDTVLGVGKNTAFINNLIDCGVIVRVYNASGTRKIGSIYSINPRLIKQLYDAFDSIPDFWENCKVLAEIDDETFEELSKGMYSDTVSVYQDNVEEGMENHAEFVEFCANKSILPSSDVISDIKEMISNNIFSTGWNYNLRDMNEVAQVYSFVRDYSEEKADLKNIRKVANSVYTNAHNYIKYKPSIHIKNKIFNGVGIRAVTELCTKPKFETSLEQMCKSLSTYDMDLSDEYRDVAWKKSREYILSRYGELDHFDVSSSIPHVMMLMNTGKFDVDSDLYYELSDKPVEWNEQARKIIKQSYMQAHFSSESVKKILNNIKFKYLEHYDYMSLDWIDRHSELLLTFIANVKSETPDGQSTMDFYHESNIFILLRKLWTDRNIKVIGQVYDSFWFEKDVMTESQFNADLKYVAELYAAKFGKVPFDKIL